MAELTELEVQEMIQKAREGDAEANYRMSEWALEQAVAEPEEERWNRLAAKCLVKAAEAGYKPAQERMDALINQLEEEKSVSAPSEEETAGGDSFWDEPESQAEPVTRSRPTERGQKGFSWETVMAGASAAFGKAVDFFRDLTKKPQEGETSEDGETAAPASRGRRESGSQKHAAGLSTFFRFSDWDEVKWKKVQRVCLVVCAALVLLILILLISGRGNKAEEPEETPQIPAAATAEPVQVTPTPAAELYPDEETRSAIEDAELDVKPGDTDYVEEATTATVSTQGSDLNMRKGPDSNYGRIDAIPNGTKVDVYAYRGSWALVNYNGKYGWCSTSYLK